MHSLINTHLALAADKTIAKSTAGPRRGPRRRFRPQAPSSAGARSAPSERPAPATGLRGA
jgi:hypothetical protein